MYIYIYMYVYRYYVHLQGPLKGPRYFTESPCRPTLSELRLAEATEYAKAADAGAKDGAPHEQSSILACQGLREGMETTLHLWHRIIQGVLMTHMTRSRSL